MSRKILQLSLKSIDLVAPLQVGGGLMILCDLILPRPSIRSRSIVKNVSVKKGKLNLTRAPFYEKGLFKEVIEGMCGVRVSITRPQKNQKLAEFARAVLATGIESAGDVLAAGVSLSALRPLIREPFDQVAEKVEDSEESFIAMAGLDIGPEGEIPKVLEFPLKLTQSIRMASSAASRKSQKRAGAQYKTYRKGSPVGVIRLEANLM